MIASRFSEALKIATDPAVARRLAAMMPPPPPLPPAPSADAPTAAKPKRKRTKPIVEALAALEFEPPAPEDEAGSPTQDKEAENAPPSLTRAEEPEKSGPGQAQVNAAENAPPILTPPAPAPDEALFENCPRCDGAGAGLHSRNHKHHSVRCRLCHFDVRLPGAPAGPAQAAAFWNMAVKTIRKKEAKVLKDIEAARAAKPGGRPAFRMGIRQFITDKALKDIQTAEDGAAARFA
jgi:hypothetical protein